MSPKKQRAPPLSEAPWYWHWVASLFSAIVALVPRPRQREQPDSVWHLLAPVHLFTVAREMGHRSVTMIEKHYGHPQNVRHRNPVVEYVDNMVEFTAVARGA